MGSVPYSRFLFGLIPWYSFLIVTGAAIAIVLAVREEKIVGFKKDTVIDFALIVLPCGIIGARIYYVAFSWPQFKDDLISVLKVWEGGIAIYGAVIAGLLTAWIFCRVRKISFSVLCDIIAPGLILAQSIGRWGNYFNQEAYGLEILNENLSFFPFAVQIQTESGLRWFMATFFYESVWNLIVFIFLLTARRKWFRYHGDVISFYAILYACGRLIIEDFRMDSLYAASSIRVSQLLSVLMCLLILFRYFRLFLLSSGFKSPVVKTLFFVSCVTDAAMMIWLTNLIPSPMPVLTRFILLLSGSVINLATIFVMYGKCAEGRIVYANVQR